MKFKKRSADRWSVLGATNEHRRTRRNRDDPRPLTAPTDYTPTFTIKDGTGRTVTNIRTIAVRAATNGLIGGAGGAGGSGRAVMGKSKHAVQSREDTTPILAFKAASLLFDLIGEEDYPGPIVESNYDHYKLDLHGSVAYCGTFGARPHGHADVPSLTCTCGFYAVRSPEHAAGYTFGDNGAVMLTVELYGKVIVHEHGYRAEKMRVLRVSVAGCWYCEQEPDYVAAVIPRLFDVDGFAKLRGQRAPMASLCNAHAQWAKADVLIPLTELAERLDVEVGHNPLIKPPRTSWRTGS